MRSTKIISTVGPASDRDNVLDELIAAGTNVFRLNFSHGTHESQAATFARIRAAAARANRQVGILQDLSGPKIRTGLLAEGRPLQLEPGDPLRIETGDFVGGPGRVSTPFAGLARGVRPGDRLLLSDGLIELRVDATDGKAIQTTVVEGGELGQHKGINAPGVVLPASAVTVKDAEDLRFGLSLGVDLVGLSFVQNADDVRRARQIIEDSGAEVPIVAKLERPQALDHLDDILAACEAVMIARGDLGLEMPLEQVPRAQKEITRRARVAKRPVILATQVLESMTKEARPTRAEVSDAANAVDDGVDAIMLAGETAVGAFPVRAVQTLDAVIRDAEASPTARMARPRRELSHNHVDAICDAAVMLAEHADAAAIVAVTHSGGTARRLAALRPRVPILGATNSSETARRLTLLWGVTAVLADLGPPHELPGRLIGRQLLEGGHVHTGATVVLVHTDADLSAQSANYLKIHRL